MWYIHSKVLCVHRSRGGYFLYSVFYPLYNSQCSQQLKMILRLDTASACYQAITLSFCHSGSWITSTWLVQCYKYEDVLKHSIPLHDILFLFSTDFIIIWEKPHIISLNKTGRNYLVYHKIQEPVSASSKVLNFPFRSIWHHFISFLIITNSPADGSDPLIPPERLCHGWVQPQLS